MNYILYLLSTPAAIAIYLIVLMLLIAGLTAYVLVALHLIRKTADKLPANGAAQTATDSRFSSLARIDEAQASAPAPVYDQKPLDEICSDFRNYAAGNLRLYYDIADIRRFVAGMGMSHLMILRGMSGTGKTSLAYAAGEYFGNPSTIVPIQPMWKERSDII
ncbi:MAG: hypothetical protein E7436_02010, partial [Ruminococcaceae bacterium]|nr:hypothetical protein [Oscillospiraceae bacterium]